MIVLEELKRRDHENRDTATDRYKNLCIEATERELTADDADVTDGVLRVAGRTPEQFERDIAKRREMLELEPIAQPHEELRIAANAAFNARVALEQKHAEALAKVKAKHEKEISEAYQLENRAKLAAKESKTAWERLVREFPQSEIIPAEQKTAERERRERNVEGLTGRIAELEQRIKWQAGAGLPAERNAFGLNLDAAVSRPPDEPPKQHKCKE